MLRALLRALQHALFRAISPCNTLTACALPSFRCAAEIIRNAPAPVLVEAALQREKGSFLTDTGALSVRSGAKTGRSPKDKRVVDEAASTDNVWWGPVNIKMSHEAFMINRERAIDYINTRERVYVVDGYAGHDHKYRVAVRVICVRAYQ